MTGDGDNVNVFRITRVNDIDRHVGKKLRLRRIMLGLSQQILGDAVGVTIQQIQKYEKATNRVASGKLYQFAKLLHVPVQYFFAELDEAAQRSRASFAESQEEFVDKDAVQEREVLSLVKSYNEIRDTSVRKKILDLVRTLSV